MADRKILIAPQVVFQGSSLAKPAAESLPGSSLLLITTGRTKNAALTALSGTSASSRCYSIPISNYDEIVFTASTAPVYVACAAVRPGSSLYFSEGQCQYVYENNRTEFYLTCPLQWAGRPFMTMAYVTGFTASSPYYFRNYQDLSGSTYQNKPLAKMADAQIYYNFCNPTGGVSFITESEMGNMYAPIQSAYYNEYSGMWVYGAINHDYGIEGYTVTFNQNGVYLFVDNNTSYGYSCNVTLVAYEAGNLDSYDYVILEQSLLLSPWNTNGLDVSNTSEPPEGEIGGIAIIIDADGHGFNFSADIQTGGMGSISDQGQTDGYNTTYPVGLSNNIEIQRIEIQISN